ncbi:transmembrane sensor [Catalinimonas alkaloidigena]|uniref:FecR family protein n=1 Tax=Catalinimonas alkaloidigena TaxID=1075417 RepID=UPI002404F306|nr:FecR domain-containing protein [Catalinimonas alkaloidigena]MDF9798981.1 transmembrane sensor [Catalinimonas alkaloidigena]
MDYSRYTVHDFVLDEYFQEWVFHPNQQNTLFWNQWLLRHPYQQKDVEEAKRLLLSLSFEEEEVTPREIVGLKSRVLQNISSNQTEPLHLGSIKPPYLKWAASVAVLLSLSVLFYFLLLPSPAMIEYRASYGEIKEIILPDGSQVTLNANSSIQYNADWKQQESRKVWLQGEAFFKVVKDSTPQEDLSANNTGSAALIARKFEVLTPELRIEVLGTQFNVRARHSATEVVLQEGNVQLSLLENREQPTLAMKPGERVIYSEQKLSQQVVEPEKYLSWRQNQLIFEDQSLAEVAQRLEDIYGVEVVFDDEQLQHMLFRGTVPSDNIEILLEALSGIYQIEISREEDVITFHAR